MFGLERGVLKHGNGAAIGFGLAAVLFIFGACSPTMHTRGNLPDPSKTAQIEPGKHSRDKVEALLGPPSTIGLFDKETWYYVGKRTKTLAFFKPTLMERTVFVIRFDKSGVVEQVYTLDATDGREIKPVARITPTRGKELTFLEQLVGNVGRFNKPDPNRRP